MQAQQDLLTEVRRFCNPSTGEVLERIPDPLMQQLRAAKLARGIPRCKSTNTQTNATWFVFFTDEIRNHVMAEFRAANQKRIRAKKSAAAAARAAETNRKESSPSGKRGLAKFRDVRRPLR